MVPSCKLATLIVPQTVTSGQSAFGYFDTKGYDFAIINLVSETVAASDIPTVLRLGESDTVPANFAGSTAIAPTFVGGAATSTSVGFVIPTPVTTTSVGVNTYAVQFRVNTKARKRYLTIEFSPITTHTTSVDAVLFKGEEMPRSDAQVVGSDRTGDAVVCG